MICSLTTNARFTGSVGYDAKKSEDDEGSEFKQLNVDEENGLMFDANVGSEVMFSHLGKDFRMVFYVGGFFIENLRGERVSCSPFIGTENKDSVDCSGVNFDWENSNG